MKKLFLLLFLGMFLISFATSAELIEKVGFDFDNVEQFTKDITTSKYGKYEIRNSVLGLEWFQYGQVADIELKNNSDVCGEDCFAEKEIILYEDGVLVDEIIFKTLRDDGSWVEQPIRSYSFSYMDKDNKVNYELGDVVPAGTYTLRLEGKKKPIRTVDWIIKSNGIWTDEWAVWEAGLVLYDEYDSSVNASKWTGAGLGTTSETTTYIIREQVDSASAGSCILDSTGSSGINLKPSATQTSRANFTASALGYSASGTQTARVTLYIRDSSSNTVTLDSFTSAVGSSASKTWNVNMSANLTHIVATVNGATTIHDASGLTGSTWYLRAEGRKESGGSGGDCSATFFNVYSLSYEGVVTSNSPANNYVSSTSEVFFNCTAELAGTSSILNMSLVTNESGTWEVKNTSSFGSANTNSTLPGDFIGTVASITNKRGVEIVMNQNRKITNVTVYVASSPPPTTAYILDEDENQLINASISGGIATFNYVLSTDNTYYIAVDNNGSSYNSRQTVFNNPPYYFDEFNVTDGYSEGLFTNRAQNILSINSTVPDSPITTTWTRSFSDGSHLWTCQACDSDGDCGVSADNRTLFVDATLPVITVESPSGTMGAGNIGESETLNVTFTDSFLDSCWYDYTGTNVSIPGCLSGVKNSTTFTLVAGDLSMTIYANDTAGGVQSKVVTWDYNLTANSQTYPSTSVESSMETYVANLTYDSTEYPVITGTLELNGTTYIGTRSGSGDSAIMTADATMPSVASETDFPATWTISLTNVDGTTDYTLTSHNVTVAIINLSLCDATNNVSFWNFTILNESNGVEINSTFDVTFTVSPTGSSATNEFSYSDTSGTNSQYDFCITPGSETYTASTDIELTKSGYVNKFYNFEEVALSNTTREDNLYMLTSDDSTTFILHVVYVDSSDVTGAEVRVKRYYPGTGESVITEILTTNEVGEAIGHLLAEDADYTFEVLQSGVSIYNSSSTKITCKVSPCTVTLTLPITVDSGIEGIEDLSSTLEFSIGNIFTYTYSDTSGNFDQARLYVYTSFPANGTRVVPCNTTKTDSSGVLICNVNAYGNGTYVASGYITRNSDEFLDKRIIESKGDMIYNQMGNDGLLWAFFIFISIVMLGVARPSLAIIFGSAGIIILSFLQIVNIGALSIVAISAIAVILLMRIGKE